MKKTICLLLTVIILLPLGAFTVSADGSWYHAEVWLDGIENIRLNDVDESAWYSTWAKWAVNTGSMIGAGNGYFLPNETMTREMAVVSIYSMLKWSKSYKFIDIEYNGTSSFSDVKPNKWYSKAVEWAYQNGITAGVGNGRFGIGQPITRQDYVVMLCNMPNLFGDLSGGIENSYIYNKTDCVKIVNANNVSEYAKYAMCFALCEQQSHIQLASPVTYFQPLIVGDGKGNIFPHQFISRAEAATILAKASTYYKAQY